MTWQDTLLSLPSVCDFLQSDAWEWDFPPQYLSRGEHLSKSGKVIGISHFVGSSTNFVGRAKVQGTRSAPYQVGLIGKKDGMGWVFWGDCTCPIGSDCKHVADFVYKLRETIQQHQIAPDSGEQQKSWLEALSKELTSSPAKKKSAKKKRRTSSLIYLVKPRADGLLEVNFGKITHPANRSPKIENRSFTPNIRRSTPAYFQEGDEEFVIAFQQRLPKAPGSEYHWEDIRTLSGPVASDLLPRLLETERLFLYDEFHAANSYQIPPFLTEGPSIELSPQWEVDEDGSCKPVIGLPSKSTQLLEINGPYYLDAESHQVGPVALAPGQTLSLLRLWASGPRVSADQAAELTAAMEGTHLPRAIPRPVQLEEKILKYDSCQPVLSMSRTQALAFLRQETFGGFVRTSAPELPVATLSFRYDSHDLPYSSESKEEARIAQGDHVLVIPRDLKVEKKALKQLKKESLSPLIDLFEQDQVNASARNCFGPHSHPEDWGLAWAGHLSQTFPKLREEGWEIIETDSFDISLTRAEELFTDFSSDEEKGIDWFQFDTGVVNSEGQRISLMNLIAQVLSSEVPIPEDDQLKEDERILVADEMGREFFELPAKRFFRIVRSVRDLFNRPDDGLHRLEAAKIAQELALDDSGTVADLRALGEQLAKKEPHKPVPLPKKIKADLRDYQKDGFQWLQFLARHHLHGILADDMGLGKTLQTLTHLTAEIEKKRNDGKPTLVVAPTSVVPNWAAEAEKFAPSLKVLVLHGADRKENFKKIDKHHLVITSYALLQRDSEEHQTHSYHLVILDEAHYIKNPKAKVAVAACQLDAKHRLCLSGTPMENHLGELWSLSRFLMPGLLGNQTDFNAHFRSPIERHQNEDAQRSLNNKVGSLILRRTKDQVVKELPAKTEIIHRIPLNKAQQDLYESVRVAMDKKVRSAIEAKGLARSQIIVLDALLKLRQICCHPQLIKTDIAKKAKDSAKLDFLVELLDTLIEEGRRILLFSQFTTMLGLIEAHLKKRKIKYVKITGATRDRKTPVEKFQAGEIPVFLISLKAGGTGLNLTAADTVIHYDPWWNPAAENQATDRAHRIGQKNPVFVHKLITEGSIEERILELQARKSKLVEALLSEKTNKLQLDTEMLENLLSPLEPS